ncbi:TIGR03943 family protein [Streptomyces sp. SID5910]|uniref:TIGR03943 family putative permease subunit n=1 Tax=Streptomyces sp. SID5910 TaxID=2690312 RepID=UPI00136F3254|nr:TIGR03943 family protein [Streptomyces sp. SID5910]
MRRYGPAVLLLLVGVAVLRISLFSDLYLRYVQPGLRPYLIASGALLGLLGLVRGALTARAARPGASGAGGHGHPAEGEPGHGHSHAGGPRVAWLLALPAVALLCFPPPALGSYSAAREEARRTEAYVGTFPALPAGDPVELSLTEFASRAAYDSGYSLRGRTVQLTGFVTRDDDTWYVTRLRVTCCAADATAVKAEVRGERAPETDTWVTVTGTWHPEGELGSTSAWPPALDATTVHTIAEPSDPYEER